MRRVATPDELERAVRRYGPEHARAELRRHGLIPPIEGSSGPAVANNVTAGNEQSGAVTTFTPSAFAATTGNAIVVVYRYFRGTPTAPSDTALNTYTNVAGATGSGGQTWSTWVAQNITGNASNVVQGNASTGLTYACMHVYEIFGVITSGVIDVAIMGAGTTTSTFSTVQASEMILLFASQDGGTNSTTTLAVNSVAMTDGTSTVAATQTGTNTQTGYLAASSTLSGVDATFTAVGTGAGYVLVSLKASGGPTPNPQIASGFFAA